MTKKYEKFEEWMLHAPVVTSNGDSGKIVQSVGEGRVAVLLDRGVEILSRVWSLEFIEVGSTRSSPIPWEVGQVVWDLFGGKGKVVCVDGQDSYPVKVVFDDGEDDYYTANGKLYRSDEYRRLFFSEPTVIADTMPPKKPFVPKLKEGDELVVVYIDGAKEFIVVMEEVADRVFDAAGHVYMKSEIEFYKLGEEIKWEN